MLETLVVIGLACVIAAVVGGGLSVTGIEVPVVSSVRRQVLLAIVGVAIVGSAVATQPRDPDPVPSPTPSTNATATVAGEVPLPDACAKELTTPVPAGGVWQRATSSDQIRVARWPSAIAVTRNFVWIVHRDGRVTRFDPDAPPSHADPLPHVQIGHEGKIGQVGIAVGITHVWVTKNEGGNDSTGFLARIDSASSASPDTLVDREAPIPAPDNVAFGAAAVWVTTDEGELIRLRPSDFPTHVDRAGVEIGGNPHGLWAADSCVYVATQPPGGFSVFGAADGNRLHDYRVGAGGEISGGAGALWMTGARAEQRVLRVDPRTPWKASPIAVAFDTANDALAVGDSGAWTAAQNARTIAWIDPAGRLPPQEITVAGRPVGIAIALDDDPDSEVVWITEPTDRAGAVDHFSVARNQP